LCICKGWRKGLEAGVPSETERGGGRGLLAEVGLKRPGLDDGVLTADLRLAMVRGSMIVEF